MLTFSSITQVLDFAMQSEQEAVDFYTRLAQQSTNESMKQVFTSFAKEEMEHKLKLLKVREVGLSHWKTEFVADLKIADYTPDVPSLTSLSYEQALVVAMKKEKAAFRLYSDLAEGVSNPELKDMFKLLAMEESKHKLRFELEYDQEVLREN